jgi:transcription initiation factor TFIIIB Brf1 subunit/transcription initiation factor TFIIB
MTTDPFFGVYDGLDEQIEAGCDRLDVDDATTETAVEAARQYMLNVPSQSRSPNVIAASAVYYAVLRHNERRINQDDVVAAFDTNQTSVRDLYKQIAESIDTDFYGD